VKQKAIDAARAQAIEELQTHVENLRELLYCLEMEMSAECWP
jgi:ribosomal protein L29